MAKLCLWRLIASFCLTLLILYRLYLQAWSCRPYVYSTFVLQKFECGWHESMGVQRIGFCFCCCEKEHVSQRLPKAFLDVSDCDLLQTCSSILFLLLLDVQFVWFYFIASSPVFCSLLQGEFRCVLFAVFRLQELDLRHSGKRSKDLVSVVKCD